MQKNDLLKIAHENGTPVFIYALSELRARADEVMRLTLPYGSVVRYAVKANPHERIVHLFDDLGLHFDASSSYEAIELLKLGISGEKISLSSQQPAHNLPELLEKGVQYVATSLHQLELFAKVARAGSHVGLRVNPGLGAGYSNRLTTGGANSSFGLWNAYVPQALEAANKYGVVIDRVHVHIGTGADPKVWQKALETALEIVAIMPDVVALDIGGGYKTHYFGDDQETDMERVFAVFATGLKDFQARTGREISLEIEPGRWLVAHAGTLVAEIVDIVDTGPDGHTFLRLDTGMNDIMRPGMYGAQHEMTVLSDMTGKADYVVVGHNCETGDILTPAPSDPEGLEPRHLNKAAIGDLLAIHDTGAYCYTFAAAGYNAFPQAKLVFIENN